MALIKSGSYKNSGSVYLDYRLHADYVSGSGNNRTVKVTIEFKCGGNPSYPSWWGYPMTWRPYLNHTSPVYGSWSSVKGNETWNTNDGWRSYSQTLTINVGSSNATNVTVGFATDSTGDNGWDGGDYAAFSVPATNVAPTISGTITADGSTGNKYIPENQKSIALTAPAASDANGNLSGYRFAVSVNGGGYTEIYKGSSRTYTHSISGGEGTTYRYSCYAYDAAGATSGTIYSPTLTKNRLTGAAVASSLGSIAYNTTSIPFTWSAPNNTNGNGTFSYELISSEVTIYRATSSTSSARSMNVAIVSSAPSSGAYILKSDIINKFKNASYKGTLNFTLRTKNAYGSTKETKKAITVNLQSKPATPGSCSINSGSTAYRSTTIGNKYLIPDDTRTIKIDWGSVTGAVGEAITYDLYASYAGGSFGLIAGGLSTTTYTHAIGKQSLSRDIKYRVYAKASYGTSSDPRDSAAATLHFYNSPTIATGTITRTSTTVDVVITVKTNTSIPNVNTKGSARLYTKGSSTQFGSTVNLTQSQAAQTIKFTGLVEANPYDLKVTYNDDTGFSSDTISPIIAISANLPIFFINKYGAGVNGVQASSSAALNVKGDITPTGTLKKAGTSQSWLSGARGEGVLLNMTSQNGYTPIIRQKTTNGVWTQGVYTNDAFHLTYMIDENISAGNNTVSTQYTFPKDKGGTVYTTGNKPTAADIGAAPSSHSHNYLPTSGGTLTGNLTMNAGTKIVINGADVVSSGKNTNGYYVRLYDGTQICWKSIQFSKSCTSAWGGIYATGFFELGSWPAAFVDYPVTSMSVTRGNNTSFFVGGHYLDTGTNVGSIELYRGTSASVVEGWVHAMGIGKWK